jgi:proteic killer suppression protein
VVFRVVTESVAEYAPRVITHFADRRLERLHLRRDPDRIPASLLKRIQRILDHLDRATVPGDMDFSGYRLHPLHGEYAGAWAVSVNNRWRVVFRFEGVDVREVRLIDYH